MQYLRSYRQHMFWNTLSSFRWSIITKGFDPESLHGQFSPFVNERLAFRALQTGVSTSDDKTFIGFQPTHLQNVKLGTFRTNVVDMIVDSTGVYLLLNRCWEGHGDGGLWFNVRVELIWLYCYCQGRYLVLQKVQAGMTNPTSEAWWASRLSIFV